MKRKSVIFYKTVAGRAPLKEWLIGLKDITGAMRVQNRLDKLQEGNLGDCRAVGGGVYELRFMFGPGYRVYFGQDGDLLVVLLCGGDKRTQSRDILRAQELWADWKRRFI